MRLCVNVHINTWTVHTRVATKRKGNLKTRQTPIFHIKKREREWSKRIKVYRLVRRIETRAVENNQVEKRAQHNNLPVAL